MFKAQVLWAVTPYQLHDPQDKDPSFPETPDSIY